MARIYRIHTVRAAACAECRTHSSNLLLYAGYSNCTAELDFFSFFILFNVDLGFNVEIARTNEEFHVFTCSSMGSRLPIYYVYRCGIYTGLLDKCRLVFFKALLVWYCFVETCDCCYKCRDTRYVYSGELVPPQSFVLAV